MNTINELAIEKIYIDKRPLFLLFLIEYKNAFLLIFIFSLFFIFINSEFLPQSLTLEAYRTAIIFVLAVFLWITNIIPLAITSLIIMGLLSTFNVLESNKIFSFFGNESLFFILGSFIIAAGISASGLSNRISYFTLSKFKDSPEKLVLAIFFLAAFMSHIMTEHAVAALLFPVLLSVSKNLNLDTNSILGKYIFFALAWGCSIGGIVTLLGGARNPLAIGILKETTGQSISFLDWIIAVAPPAYLLLTIVAFYLKYTLKSSSINSQQLSTLASLKTELVQKVKFKEVKALFVFLITIYMWIFHNKTFGVTNIALISAALFFVLNVIKWEDAKKEINWGTILMYGGAIALGRCLIETGLLNYLSTIFISNINISHIGFICLIPFLSLVLTQSISNSVVVIMLLPIVLQIASNFNFSPILSMFLVAVPSGLDFMLPIGSPPNAIAYSSGFIKMSEFIYKGFFLNLVALAIFILFAMFYWPLIGFY